MGWSLRPTNTCPLSTNKTSSRRRRHRNIWYVTFGNGTVITPTLCRGIYTYLCVGSVGKFGETVLFPRAGMMMMMMVVEGHQGRWVTLRGAAGSVLGSKGYEYENPEKTVYLHRFSIDPVGGTNPVSTGTAAQPFFSLPSFAP